MRVLSSHLGRCGLVVLLALPLVGCGGSDSSMGEQKVALHGVELGDRLSEAVARLRTKAHSCREGASSDAYEVRCMVEGRIVDVSAGKEDVESRSRARVQTVSSRSKGTPRPGEVEKTFKRYKKRWTKKLGQTHPSQPACCQGKYEPREWKWETERLEARIRYVTERESQPKRDLDPPLSASDSLRMTDPEREPQPHNVTLVIRRLR